MRGCCNALKTLDGDAIAGLKIIWEALNRLEGNVSSFFCSFNDQIVGSATHIGSEQPFKAIISETEAEVKITIKASTGGDEDYESMDRDELESLLEELQEQREDLEDEEPDDPCSDAYDEWEERCEELDEKIEEIEELLDD